MHRDITLLSTADWDNPFWTNKQHVAVELARRGHRVLYIDSLGLRRPSVSAQDIGRISRRLLKALMPPRQVRDRLWVWSPLVVPLQRFKLVRFINRICLGSGLAFWSWVYKLKRDLLWTYNPMTLQLLPTNKFKTMVYHCVDEIKAQPGMPSSEIESFETELLQRADFCFVTAEGLLESRLSINANTYYFPNVADYEHFSKARDPDTQVPPDISAIAAPRIGFIGAISGYKVDFSLVRELAVKHPDWSIVLIGKVGEGDPWTDITELRNLSNVHFMGPRKYSSLPGYLKALDVAMLPSVLNEYTAGMFPMKFFEYLAAGCPIVSTDLPALRAFSEVAFLATDRSTFIAGIEKALRGDCAMLEQRIEAAREQTYENRTEKMLMLIHASAAER